MLQSGMGLTRPRTTLPQVPVEWTEMPGSKIRFTSIFSMAFELVMIKVSGSRALQAHGLLWVSGGGSTMLPLRPRAGRLPDRRSVGDTE